MFDLSSLPVYGKGDLVDFQGAVVTGNKLYFVPARYRFVPRLSFSVPLPAAEQPAIR